MVERKADGGFDAVVGNPPWIRQEALHDDKALLLRSTAPPRDPLALVETAMPPVEHPSDQGTG